MENTAWLKSCTDKYKKKVLKFNADLEEYYKVSGSRELPIIDCTIIGYDSFEPYEIHDTPTGFKVDVDGIGIEITATEEDGVVYIDGWDNGYDNLKESIQFDRRRLRKAWKIWRAENPDEELEKLDDDNE